MEKLMLLLQSWKESFNMFKPKSITQLGLVTLKSSLQSYGILVYFFWWLLLLTVIIEGSCYYPECLFKGIWSYSVIKGLKSVLLALMCAIARPSVMLKKWPYFNIYIFRCLITAYLLLSLPTPMLFGFGMILLFATFFYLDSYGSTKDILLSLVRGCAMFLYNLPLCGVSTIVALLVYSGVFYLLGMYSSYIFLIVTPGVFAWVKNIYVKRLHDQFNIYYTV